MKKIITMLAVLVTVGLNAQEAASTGGTTKKMWLSGNAGFGTDNVKDGNKTSNWNFGPAFGFFLNEKMAVGLGVGLNGTKSVDPFKNPDYEETDKSMGWQVAPFFRYYFAGAGNFRFFGDLYVAIGGGKNTFETTDPNATTKSTEQKYGTFGAGLRPGMQYWFNEKWSMASSIALLGFNSRTDNKGAANNGEVKSSQLDLNLNFTAINFALYFHF